MVLVGLGEAAAFGDVEVLHLGHVGGVAADADVGRGLLAVDDEAGGGLHGADLPAERALALHRVVLVNRDDLALLKLHVVVVAGDDRRLLGDGEDVGALLVDLGGDVDLRAVDERHDGDQRGDADDHAEQREHGAQLVRPERLEGDPECFLGLHERSLESIAYVAVGAAGASTRTKVTGCSSPVMDGTREWG